MTYNPDLGMKNSAAYRKLADEVKSTVTFYTKLIKKIGCECAHEYIYIYMCACVRVCMCIYVYVRVCIHTNHNIAPINTTVSLEDKKAI